MVEWYLDRAVAADLVLRPTRRRVGPRFGTQPTETTFTSHHEALRWLENERRNILLAIRSASEQGWDSLTWEFCEALWGFFLHTRHYDDWLEMHAMGIPAAQRVGDTVAEARLHTQLAAALTNLRRYDDAIRENHEALRLAEEADDEFTKAAALSELAGAAQGKGDLPAALAYLTRAKEVRDVIGTDRAVALCQRRIGEVLAELGRHEEAITALREAADAMALLDRAQHARALTSLGSVYLRAGHVLDAIPLLTNALETTRQLGSTHYEAEVLVVLGDIAWQRGETDMAQEHWTGAHSIYSASGDPKTGELADRLKRLPSPCNSDP
jgi:tetratricopeptide (TPR) repeat protein